MARRKPPDRTKRTPEKEAAFLAALRACGNISKAARDTHLSRSVVYAWRDSGGDFAARWDEALEDATDRLEEEARRRAELGVQRMKFHQGRPILVPKLDSEGVPILDGQGEPVMVPYLEHEYSDTLLIFLLKARRPDIYRERVSLEHEGSLDVNVTRRIVGGADD